MKLTKRTQANRRNARRSTGPRSPAGKRKVATNARRHGFAVPISDIPELSANAEQLAILICGRNADPGCLKITRRITDAQIDLSRVRSARMSIIERAIINPRHQQDPYSKRLHIFQEKMQQVYEAHGISHFGGRGEQHHNDPPPNGTGKVEREAAAIADVSRDLTRLERYERRTRSRRKSAIRAFDDFRHGI